MSDDKHPHPNMPRTLAAACLENLDRSTLAIEESRAEIGYLYEHGIDAAVEEFGHDHVNALVKLISSYCVVAMTTSRAQRNADRVDEQGMS